MKRTGFKAYVVKHCDVCNGGRPHSPKGACQGCKQREKATPGRQLYQRARALQRAKKASSKPKVSATKQAAKTALPIAKGVARRRAGGRCEVCGQACKVGHAHHRRPQQAGGTSSLEVQSAANLIWIHPECHEHIESFRTHSYQLGLLVFQSADPAKVPVRLHGGWCLLGDDGSMTRVNPPDDAEVS